MFARVNITHAKPEMAGRVVQYANETIIPAMKKLNGFKGYLGLVDRATGKAYAITFWDSEAALKASEAAAGQARSSAVSDLTLSPPEVERMEVLIDTRA